MGRSSRKLYSVAGRAGCVQLRRVQQTGTLVGVYRCDQAELDAEGGDWATVCEAHGTVITHQTQRIAFDHAAEPAQWCQECESKGDSVTATTWQTDAERHKGAHPHGISCPGCRAEDRCNYCGQQYGDDYAAKVRFRRQRCTNGRCPSCCARRCRHATRG